MCTCAYLYDSIYILYCVLFVCVCYRNRGSARFPKAEELTIDTAASGPLMDDVWVGKRGRGAQSELLAAIKLAGVHAPYVAISPTFTYFVTIDESGLLYIMNVLRPSSSTTTTNSS